MEKPKIVEPNETHKAIAWGLDSAAKVAGFTLGSPFTVPIGAVGLGGIFVYQSGVYAVMAPGWACQQIMLIWRAIHPVKAPTDSKIEEENARLYCNICGLLFLVSAAGILIGLVSGTAWLALPGLALAIVFGSLASKYSDKVDGMINRRRRRRKAKAKMAKKKQKKR